MEVFRYIVAGLIVVFAIACGSSGLQNDYESRQPTDTKESN